MKSTLEPAPLAINESEAKAELDARNLSKRLELATAIREQASLANGEAID